MKAATWGAVAKQQSVLPIHIQLELYSRGLPRWRFSGLVATEVREGKERILAAIQASGYKLPRAGVRVAFFPADQKKTGSSLDLAIALALLQAHQLIPKQEIAAVAELDLGGKLLAVEHEFALADKLLSQEKVVILPRSSLPSFYKHPNFSHLRFCATLQEAAEVLKGRISVVSQPREQESELIPPKKSLSQSLVRIISLALAGGHHTFLFGSPGTGKTTAREVIEYLLPAETNQEWRARNAMKSFFPKHAGQPLLTLGPHHTRGEIFGTLGKPGLLAGTIQVLFLDEFLEFRRECREGFRSYLEINQTQGWTSEPSFTVIATSNPCPCGYSGTVRCVCRPDRKKQYWQRLSGALFDRIAVLWRVGENDFREFSPKEWLNLRAQVQRARDRQAARVADGFPAYARNYDWEDIVRLQPSRKQLDSQHSFRRQLLTFQVAQTLADWNENDRVTDEILWEAEQLTYSEEDTD